MYEFRDKYEKEWNLNLIKGDCPPVNEIDSSLPPAARSAARKTEGLKKILKKYNFKGIVAGIRRDEQGLELKRGFLVQGMKLVNGILKINLQNFGINPILTIQRKCT